MQGLRIYHSVSVCPFACQEKIIRMFAANFKLKQRAIPEKYSIYSWLTFCHDSIAPFMSLL